MAQSSKQASNLQAQMSSSPMSSTPYPATIPYADIDDFRFAGPIHVNSLTPVTVYAVDEFCVGTIAYICNLVLMAPAFLVRHASIASRLYKVLLELKRCPPLPDRRMSAESVKFEKKLYIYARHLIKTLVPGAILSSNRTAPSPAEFIAEFATFVKGIKRREAYILRCHERSVSVDEEREQWNYLLATQHSAFVQVNGICHDPIAIDKVPSAVNAYVKFAFLHNHILSTLASDQLLTDMIDDYWALIEYMREKKLAKNAINGLTTLVSAAQLSRNIIRARIPPPPPEPPVLERADATYNSDNAGLVW